jgi:hypothetical protein
VSGADESRRACVVAERVTNLGHFHNNSAATLDEVVRHDGEFFERVEANALPGVIPPVFTTDGVHVDRLPLPQELEPLLAYLRKL